MELSVSRLSHEGRGISELDGKTVFVEGALPGEHVRAELTRHRGRLIEAKSLEILKPSDMRVEPCCGFFGNCGGCDLQHMDPSAQLELKQKVLLEQLKHFGGVRPDTILAPVESISTGYRRKARLGVRFVEKRGRVLVGFREKSSNYIADINDCKVLDHRLASLLPSLCDLVHSVSISRRIPQIEVAAGDAQIAIVIRHLENFTTADIRILENYASVNELDLYLQPADVTSAYKLWPKSGRERLSYSLPDQEVQIHFHPTDFIQVNANTNRHLINMALNLLAPKKNEKVLDLFCGLGNFSLPLARLAADVTGVEGNAAMVDRAIENAADNDIANAQFYCADLTQPNASADWAQRQYAKILIDPSRSGALEIVQFLSRFAANKIVYVSCNPATLARDASELVKQGYRLAAAGVLDMFPHTAHVESIAMFEID